MRYAAPPNATALLSRRFLSGLGATIDAPVGSELWMLQTSLDNAEKDKYSDGSVVDPALVDHFQAQVTASQVDPSGATARQALADNRAALAAFAAAENQDPQQTAGKTWLQWFAATPVATGIIRTGAFTSGATGINATAVNAAIAKYDDPRLRAGAYQKAGAVIGNVFGWLLSNWKVVVPVALVGGAVLYGKAAKRAVGL